MIRKGNCRWVPGENRQAAGGRLWDADRRPFLEALESRRLLTSNLTTLGDTLNDAVFAVATLPDGGRIIAGTFGGTVDFEPSVDQRGDTRTAQGDSDIFVARQSDTGTLVWVQSFGGIGGEIDDEPLYSTVQATTGDFINNIGPTVAFQGEYVSTLKVGEDGLVYIGGSFQGIVDFDPGDGAVNRMTSDEDYHDAFVAAYSATDGSLVWASSFGGRFDDTVRDLVVAPDGVIATGYFTRDADFNPTKSGVTFVEALGRDDMFVIKLAQTDSAPIGRLQWVYTAGGEAVDLQDRDSGESIALDGRGNIYVTGTYAADADFDPSTSELIVESFEDEVDGFLMRLSPRGKLDYIQSFGGEEADGGKAVAIDNQGRLYLAGYFSEVADVDPGTGARVFTARENGDAFDTDNADESEGSQEIDLFLAQLGLKGELQWAQQIGGDDYEYLSSMQVVDDGQILLSGAFAGRIAFDAQNSIVSLVGEDDDYDDDGDRDSSYDGFIARYQSDGTFIESRQYGGVGDDWTIAAVFKADRNSAEVGGFFKGTGMFNGFGTAVKRKGVGLEDLFALSSV